MTAEHSPTTRPNRARTIVIVLVYVALAVAYVKLPKNEWTTLGFRIVNLLTLIAALVVLLRSPIADYLKNRGLAIRKDLADAAAMRSAAETQLTSVRSKLAGLPAELEQLRRRGEEEVANEGRRMKDATAEEREHLLERARRDIDIQLRIARRALLEHSAALAVSLTRDRVQREITPDDQARLIDRYATGVRA